jgi:hypothetical protein
MNDFMTYSKEPRSYQMIQNIYKAKLIKLVNFMIAWKREDMQDTNGPELSDPKMKSIPQMKHALHRYAIGVKCSSTDNIIDSSASGRLLEICPRGNNKMLLYIFPRS